jgi:hypothetical protein
VPSELPLIGIPKIGMVEHIEKLEADTQHTILPMWDLCVFHDREIRIEVARASKTIAALRKRHDRAAAGTLRTRQIRRVESRLAAGLPDQRSRARGRSVWQQLLREKRVQSGRDRSAFDACRAGTQGTAGTVSILPKKLSRFKLPVSAMSITV